MCMQCFWRPGENIRFPENGVIDNCYEHGIELGSFGRATSALNPGVIFPRPLIFILAQFISIKYIHIVMY